MDKQFVYILKSQKDSSLYIGCTSDLTKRIDEHNSGLSPYPSSKMPWVLLWHSTFQDENKAFSFEKYLKTVSGKAFLNKRLI
jgi:predicted GIY-YIG superfamily endonuclease